MIVISKLYNTVNSGDSPSLSDAISKTLAEKSGGGSSSYNIDDSLEDLLDLESDSNRLNPSPIAKPKASQSPINTANDNDDKLEIEDFDKKSTDNLDDFEDEEDNGIAISDVLSKFIPSSKKLKIILGILSALILAFVVFPKIAGIFHKKPVEESIAPNVQEVQEVTTPSSNRITEFPEVVNLDKDTFTDEMIITKGVEYESNSIHYFFSGIPKHFKRKVRFYVTNEEYNQFPSGGKINISYKVEVRESDFYLTEVNIQYN